MIQGRKDNNNVSRYSSFYMFSIFRNVRLRKWSVIPGQGGGGKEPPCCIEWLDLENTSLGGGGGVGLVRRKDHD